MAVMQPIVAIDATTNVALGASLQKPKNETSAVKVIANPEAHARNERGC